MRLEGPGARCQGVVPLAAVVASHDRVEMLCCAELPPARALPRPVSTLLLCAGCCGKMSTKFRGKSQIFSIWIFQVGGSFQLKLKLLSQPQRSSMTNALKDLCYQSYSGFADKHPNFRCKDSPFIIDPPRILKCERSCRHFVARRRSLPRKLSFAKFR